MKKISVCVENRGGHDGAANGGHFGGYAEIYASRPGIATVTVAEESHTFCPGRLATHSDHIAVEVVVDEEALKADDYIIVHHQSSPQPGLEGSSRRESYELIAGAMPAWASFPAQWKSWVEDSTVQRSAVEHILRRRPDLSETVQYAQCKTSKNRIYSGWLDVSQGAGLEPGFFESREVVEVPTTASRLALDPGGSDFFGTSRWVEPLRQRLLELGLGDEFVFQNRQFVSKSKKAPAEWFALLGQDIESVSNTLGGEFKLGDFGIRPRFDDLGLNNTANRWRRWKSQHQGGSWTAVRAMPIRIAQKLGGWRPPVPRPRFERRPQSLILLAGPNGIA